jgi:hypothetical protein
VAAAFVAGLCLSPVMMPTHAQDRSALTRQLSSASDFRVRVQAAFALGNLRDESSIPALSRALGDSNPAVRAAAATAIGRIGSTRGLPALQRAQRDSSAAVRLQVERSIEMIRDAGEQHATARPTVGTSARRGTRVTAYPAIEIVPTEQSIPWPRVRYVVTLGEMENRSGFANEALEGVLRSEVTRQLNVVRGIAVMQSEIYIDDRAEREIRRRRIPNIRLDGNITRVQRQQRGRDLSVRCEISLILLDHAQRSLKGELRGAATGTEPRHPRNGSEQERRLAEQALSGAVRSAMSNATDAIARAAQ